MFYVKKAFIRSIAILVFSVMAMRPHPLVFDDPLLPCPHFAEIMRMDEAALG